ncbi:MAG: hypothetical protein ACRDYY_14760 [Acidimicrobiales bacterium]
MLEIEFRDGSVELRELELSEAGFAPGAFEAWRGLVSLSTAGGAR